MDIHTWELTDREGKIDMERLRGAKYISFVDRHDNENMLIFPSYEVHASMAMRKNIPEEKIVGAGFVEREFSFKDGFGEWNCRGYSTSLKPAKGSRDVDGDALRAWIAQL